MQSQPEPKLQCPHTPGGLAGAADLPSRNPGGRGAGEMRKSCDFLVGLAASAECFVLALGWQEIPTVCQLWAGLGMVWGAQQGRVCAWGVCRLLFSPAWPFQGAWIPLPTQITGLGSPQSPPVPPVPAGSWGRLLPMEAPDVNSCCLRWSQSPPSAQEEPVQPPGAPRLGWAGWGSAVGHSPSEPLTPHLPAGAENWQQLLPKTPGWASGAA